PRACTTSTAPRSTLRPAFVATASSSTIPTSMIAVDAGSPSPFDRSVIPLSNEANLMPGAAHEAPADLSAFDPRLDHFSRLRLVPAVRLDRDALESAYLDRSREVHPHRFATAEPSTRRRAMEHASTVNEASRTLRDAAKPSEHHVKLGGIDLDSSDPGTGAPHPDQSFLMAMIERREALDDALDEGSEALEALRDSVEDERDSEVEAAMAVLEADDVRTAARRLVTARYLARYLEE